MRLGAYVLWTLSDVTRDAHARDPRDAPGRAARHRPGIRPARHLGARDSLGRRPLGQARLRLLGDRSGRGNAAPRRRDRAHSSRGSRARGLSRVDAPRRPLRAALSRHPARRQDALDPLAVGGQERPAWRSRPCPRRDDGRHRGLRGGAHAERRQRAAQARGRPRQDRDLAPRPAHRPHAPQRHRVRAARHGTPSRRPVARRDAIVGPSRRSSARRRVHGTGAGNGPAGRHGGALPAQPTAAGATFCRAASSSATRPARRSRSSASRSTRPSASSTCATPRSWRAGSTPLRAPPASASGRRPTTSAAPTGTRRCSRCSIAARRRPRRASISGSPSRCTPTIASASGASGGRTSRAAAGRRRSSFASLRKDGSERWIVMRADVDRDTAGPRRVFGVAMDVTAHHRALDALREASERAAFVTQHAGIGTWEADAAGCGRWNAQMFHLRGLAPRETAPSREEWMALVHPDDVSARPRRVGRMLRLRCCRWRTSSASACPTAAIAGLRRARPPCSTSSAARSGASASTGTSPRTRTLSWRASRRRSPSARSRPSRSFSRA